MEKKEQTTPFENFVKTGIVLVGTSLFAKSTKPTKLLKEYLTDTKTKEAATLGVSALLASNAVNQDEKDFAETLSTAGGIMAAAYSMKTIKKTLQENPEGIMKMVGNLKHSNDFSKEFSENLLEIKQRLKEGSKIKDLYQEAKSGKIRSSKASDLYDKYNIDKYNIKNLKKEKLKPSFRDYFEKRVSLEYGEKSKGLTEVIGRYTTKKGEIDIKKIFEDDVSPLKGIDDYIKQSGIMKKIEKGQFEDLEKFESFLKKDHSDFYDTIKDFKKTDMDASLKDIYKTKKKNTAKISELNLGITSKRIQRAKDERMYYNFLDKYKVSSHLKKNKAGKLYDNTIFDSKSYLVEAGKKLNKIKVPFVYGGKMNFYPILNFAHIKELEEKVVKRKDTMFYVSRYTKENYKNNIKQLNKTKNVLTDLLDSKANKNVISKVTSKTTNMPYLKSTEEIDDALRKIDNEIIDQKNKLKKSKKNEDLFERLPGVKLEERKANLQLKRNKEGDFYISKDDEKPAFIYSKGEIKIKKDNSYKKIKGEYDITSSYRIKQKQSGKMGKTITENRDGLGAYIDKKDKPLEFKFEKIQEFMENKDFQGALKYLKNSEINFATNKVYNEHESLPSQFIEIIKTMHNNRQFKKELKTSKNNSILNEITDILQSASKKSEIHYKKYQQEIGESFEILAKQNEENSIKMTEFITEDKKLSKKINDRIDKFKKREYLMSVFQEKRKPFRINEFLEKADETDVHKLFKDMKLNKKEKKVYQDIIKYKEIERKVNKNLNIENHISFYDSFKETKKLKHTLKYESEYIENSFIKEEFVTEAFKTLNEESFDELLESTMKKNKIFNMDYLSKENRSNFMDKNRYTFIKKFGSEIEANDDLKNIGSKLMKDLKDDTIMSNNVNVMLGEQLDRFEGVLEGIGISRLNPEKNLNPFTHFKNIMAKRILPAFVAYQAFKTVDSGLDAAIPDEVPLVGGGITGAITQSLAYTHIGVQSLMNATGITAAARVVENNFPGLFTDTILAPLNITSDWEHLHDVYIEGKPIEVRKGRFWMSSNRSGSLGGKTSYYRPHLFYTVAHKSSGLYKNKAEKFFRRDFLPTAAVWTLTDPYYEEKQNMYNRPYPISEQLFNDIPVIGGFLNMTLGEIIKPTKLIRPEEWLIEGDVKPFLGGEGLALNPNYSPGSGEEKYIQFKQPNKLVKSFSDAFEDLKTWSGMPGFITSAVSNRLFGKSSLYEGDTTLTDYSETSSLASKYEDLELGGMFGMTEAVRRVIIKDRYSRRKVNPVTNNMPSYLPKDYYKNLRYGDPYEVSPYAEYMMPGKTFDKRTKGKRNELKVLETLSTMAPYSAEYRTLKKNIIKNISSYDELEQRGIQSSISFANNMSNKHISENTFFETDIIKGNTTIEKMQSFNSFIGSDGRTYKIHGIEDDFNRLSKQIGEEAALKKRQEIKKYLETRSSVQFIRAKNPETAIQSDDFGQSVEIFIPELDKFDIKKPSYLRYNYKKPSLPVSMLSKFFESMKNSYKPMFFNKVLPGGDAYNQWYIENSVHSQFRDWKTPYSSFINPMLEMSEEGQIMDTLFLSQLTSPGSTPFLLGGANLAAFAKGKIFGTDTPDNYKEQDEMQNIIETIELKQGKKDQTIFNISSNDNMGKMKRYLSYEEKSYLNALANEKNPEKRKEIYNKASARLQRVLNNINFQKYRYDKKQYKRKEVKDINLPKEEIPYLKLTDNSFVNKANLKKLLGKDLNTFENSISTNGLTMDGSLQKYIEYLLYLRWQREPQTESTLSPIGILSI